MDDIKSRGTAEIQFSISEKGFISDIKILSLEGSVLAGIMADALKNGPVWIPATKNNVPVQSIKKQKVTFLMPDEEADNKKKKKRRRE